MCLHLKTRFAIRHKAKKDIIVYKELTEKEVIINSNVKKVYITPYMNFEVKIGETYTSQLVKDREFVFLGIHSVKNSNDLSEFLVKVKCIIPKGAYYYKGLNCDCRSYASDQLTYVELI